MLTCQCLMLQGFHQRHFGNQNLISIIPVEDPLNPGARVSSLLPTPPDFHQRVAAGGFVQPPPHHQRMPPPRNPANPPRSNSYRPPPPVSEEPKPKAPTKFSRFEDSDSEDSDEDDLSLLASSKHDSEEEEIILEEAEDNEDLIIEVEDCIELEEVEEEVTKEEPPPPPSIPAVPVQPKTSPPRRPEQPALPSRTEVVEPPTRSSPKTLGPTSRSPEVPRKSSSSNGEAKSRKPRTPPPPSNVPTDSDASRLESRRRKFETPPDAEPLPVKKEGKIRLKRTEEEPSVKSSADNKPTRSKEDRPEESAAHQRSRGERDRPSSVTVEKKRNEKAEQDERKTKKDKRKSKEKKRKRSRTRSGGDRDVKKGGSPCFSDPFGRFFGLHLFDPFADEEVTAVKRPKSAEPPAEVDLRAELQRRRVHRHDVMRSKSFRTLNFVLKLLKFVHRRTRIPRGEGKAERLHLRRRPEAHGRNLGGSWSSNPLRRPLGASNSASSHPLSVRRTFKSNLKVQN